MKENDERILNKFITGTSDEGFQVAATVPELKKFCSFCGEDNAFYIIDSIRQIAAEEGCSVGVKLEHLTRSIIIVDKDSETPISNTTYCYSGLSQEDLNEVRQQIRDRKSFNQLLEKLKAGQDPSEDRKDTI